MISTTSNDSIGHLEERRISQIPYYTHFACRGLSKAPSCSSFARYPHDGLGPGHSATKLTIPMNLSLSESSIPSSSSPPFVLDSVRPTTTGLRSAWTSCNAHQTSVAICET